MRGQDRYGCSNHIMAGTCSNGRGIRRAVIEDGGYVRGMVDRLRELEARQDTLNERLSAAPADLPDIHPNIADIYRRKVARLAEALNHPEDRDAAASAIRGLIARIVLTPSEKWAEMDAVLHGDLGSILEWAGNGGEKAKTDISMPEMSVLVVAGARNLFCYNLETFSAPLPV